MIIMTMYCLSLRQNAVSEFQPYFSGWISLSPVGKAGVKKRSNQKRILCGSVSLLRRTSWQNLRACPHVMVYLKKRLYAEGSFPFFIYMFLEQFMHFLCLSPIRLCEFATSLPLKGVFCHVFHLENSTKFYS